MNLYLMRHAIAVAGNEPGVDTDGERSLSPKGIKRMRKAARGLKRLEIPFDALLTSPLLRARQTADVVAPLIGLEGQVEVISGLTPESSVDNLISDLTGYQNREHLLLVGHEPLLSQTVSFLLTGKRNQELGIELKKGGLCRIEIDGLPPDKPGKLHWLLAPKQLRLFGERVKKS
jgi:phosphohistidine phosphatase